MSQYESRNIQQVGGVDVGDTGSLPVTQATQIAGEDLTNNVLRTVQKMTSTYISTATTTTARTGAGVLGTVVVNGGTAGTIIGYDNTAGSGTVLFSFDSTNALAPYTFNCAFSTGLTIVTSAATKLTVNWGIY